jgi:hypothetical protein
MFHILCTYWFGPLYHIHRWEQKAAVEEWIFWTEREFHESGWCQGRWETPRLLVRPISTSSDNAIANAARRNNLLRSID